MLLGRVGQVLLVLLAQQVVSVGIFAVVRLSARLTGTLKQRLVGFGGGVGTGLEDFFGEDFGGDGRQRGNSSLQVIPARCRVSNGMKQQRWMLKQPASPESGSHSLPVTLHVSLLEIDIAIGDLARVARVWVRTRGRLPCGGGLDARHGEKRDEQNQSQ